MALQVTPGQWVKVTVKSAPKTTAGRKTLLRLFEQDPGVKKERVRVSKTRPWEDSRRGGRIWINKPPRIDLVKVERGASYKVFASLPVIRDLQSVEKYVEVSAAK